MNLQNYNYNRSTSAYPLVFQTRQSGAMQLLQTLIPLVLGNTRSSDRFDNNLNIFANSKPLDMSFDTTDPGGIPVPPAGGPVLGGDQAALAKGGRQHPNLLVTDPNKYRADVQAALKKNGLDPKKYENVILAMIWQESKGDPKAVGNDGQGSMGLMQVITANQGGKDHFKPAVSIDAGVAHFATELKAQGNDLALALAAYNQGAGGKNTEPAKKYATQIQNKAKFFEKGKTPAGQADPTSPGFHEPPLGGKSGDPNPKGLVSVDGEAPIGDEEEIETPGEEEEIDGITEGEEEEIEEDPPVDGEKEPIPETTTGGSGSDYVDMMMKALKANGAGPELLDAYMKQYELLGLVKGGAKAPTTPDTPPVTGDDGDDPDDIDGIETPGGKKKPGGKTPVTNEELGTPKTTGGVANNQGKPADAKPESKVFTNAGKVNWDKAPPNMKRLQKYVEDASTKTGVPESIIAACIWAESRADVNVEATGGGTDKGLMQINDNTYNAEIGGKLGLPKGSGTPTDPANNILAGAYYLKLLKSAPREAISGQSFKTWDLAIRAYNSGEYGGVVFSDPDKIISTGKAQHVEWVRGFVKDLEAGTLNANT